MYFLESLSADAREQEEAVPSDVFPCSPNSSVQTNKENNSFLLCYRLFESSSVGLVFMQVCLSNVVRTGDVQTNLSIFVPLKVERNVLCAMFILCLSMFLCSLCSPDSFWRMTDFACRWRCRGTLENELMKCTWVPTCSPEDEADFWLMSWLSALVYVLASVLFFFL